jgi:hypothetical protein
MKNGIFVCGTHRYHTHKGTCAGSAATERSALDLTQIQVAQRTHRVFRLGSRNGDTSRHALGANQSNIIVIKIKIKKNGV